MLQRKTKPLHTYGYILSVEAEEGIDLESLSNRLADALLYIEGVGAIEVECMGQIDGYDEEGQPIE